MTPLGESSKSVHSLGLKSLIVGNGGAFSPYGRLVGFADQWFSSDFSLRFQADFTLQIADRF